jgi:hypothetical protein
MPPNVHELSRLRGSTASSILRQLGWQDKVEKRKGSKSAAMSCWAAFSNYSQSYASGSTAATCAMAASNFALTSL